MSRSNNTELKNPSTRFLEWDGDKGGLRYYDKEKQERVSVPIPFTFLVLDTLSCIKGYSDADKSGFWSNEVRDLKTETIVVRNKNGQCEKGLYENVINSRNCVGAKYSQSVYMAFFDDKKNLVIGNIQMMGAALGAWIDFRKKAKIFESAITIDGMTEGKKGKTVYKIPVFKTTPVSKETDEKAKALDVELQNYFNLYFAKNKNEQFVSSPAEIPSGVPEHTIDDAPPEQDEPMDALPF